VFAAGPDFLLTASSAGDFYRLDSGAQQWRKIAREGVDFRGWTMAGNGERFGQALGSISIDPQDPRHWWCTDWFAAYETTDAGAHWTLRIDGLEDTVVHTLVQDVTNPRHIFMGMADDGFFVSDDAGASFRTLHTQSNNVKVIAYAAARPERMFATGTNNWTWAANQVFDSGDGGKTWAKAPQDGLPDLNKHPANSLVVSPDDPDRVTVALAGPVAAGQGGVYQSTDAGKTWHWIGAGLPAGQALFVESIFNPAEQLAAGAQGELLAACGGAGVYRRPAGATTWATVEGVRAAVTSLVADPFTPGRYLVCGDHGIDEITPQGTRAIADGRTRYLAADGVVRGRWAATVDDGVNLSTDGGRTWRPLDRALPHALNSNPLAFCGTRLVVGSGGSGCFWIDVGAARP
jgi:photosystem II stability/assembly factor-like uncharacterized protein